MNIKNVILSKQYETTENFQEIMELVIEKNINIIKVEAGNAIQIDEFVRFKIFSPGQNLTEDINDNSIVMKLEYNDFSCLFTGDISIGIEEDLVKEYSNILKSTVLKVAHHGSKTSSTDSFLNIVNPKIALIGVGKNNKFGHPNQEVLERLTNIRSKNFQNRF